MMLFMTALSFFKKPTRGSRALMRPKRPRLRIEFRIGIHIGDVVEETDGDLRATASTSRPASKGSQRRARSGFPRTPIGR
jgi:hypothetical protein